MSTWASSESGYRAIEATTCSTSSGLSGTLASAVADGPVAGAVAGPAGPADAGASLIERNVPGADAPASDWARAVGIQTASAPIIAQPQRSSHDCLVIVRLRSFPALEPWT